MNPGKTYKAIVIGVSAGGLEALNEVLPAITAPNFIPVLVVQHLSPDSEGYLPLHLNPRCTMEVKEAEDKEPLQSGMIYIAPPNYHLMVEVDRALALSVDKRVNFSRPSIDVLFETAAEIFCDSLVGVVLTGANADGAAGLARIKRFGGLTVVQDPASAVADAMPRAALKAVAVDHLLPLDEIGPFLNSLMCDRI